MRENGVFDKIKNLISVAVFSQENDVALEENLEENYATGLEYYNKWFEDLTNIDNFKKAEVYLLKALEVDPKNYGAYPALATLYQSIWFKDYTKIVFFEKSESYYEKTRLCGITNPVTLCNFATLYIGRWDHCGREVIYLNKAEQLLLKATEIDQSYDRPIKLLGDIYKSMWMSDISQTELLDKAETYLEKAYGMDQNDEILCFNLGFVYQSKWSNSNFQDNHLAEKSEEMYLKTIELDPTAYVVMANLGIIYENRWLQNKSNYNHAEKAIEWYKKSFDNDGVYTYGKVHLAKLYLIVWNYSDTSVEYLKNAEQLYLEIIEMYSEDADVVFNFAVVNSMLFEMDLDCTEYFEKAESLYIKAIKLNNDNGQDIRNLQRINKIKIAHCKANNLAQEHSNKLIELATEVIETEKFTLDTTIELGRALRELWIEDTRLTQYFELSEKLLLKSFEVDDSYRSIDALKHLYLSKWDETSDESYFVKIEEMYSDKLALNSEDEEATYALGMIYDHKWMRNKEEKEFFHKAKGFFERCLEINEHNLAYHDLGCINAIVWRENNEDEYFKQAEYYFLIGVKEDYLYSKMHLSQLYRDKWRRNTSLLEYFEKNIEITESIAENKEYHTSAIINIAEVYEELLEEDRVNVENFDKAVNHLERLFNENNYIAELAGKIGFMYHEREKEYKIDDYKTALEWYFIAYDLDNKIVWIVNQIARIYNTYYLMDKNNKESYELAKKWYELAIELDTKRLYTFAPIRLGTIFGEEWKKDPNNEMLFRKTEILYRRALEIEEDNRSANWNLACLYRDKWLLDKSKNNFFDDSVQLYEKLLDKFSDDAIFFNNLGDLYKNKWEIDKDNNAQYLEKANEMFYKSIEIDNDFYYPYVNLGKVYFSLWESDKTNSKYRELSKENFEKAYAVDYNNIFISKGLAIIKFYEYENILKDLKTLKDANKYFKYSLEEKSYYDFEDRDKDNTEYLKLAEKFFSNVVNEDNKNIEAINTLADIYAMNDIYTSKNKDLFLKTEELYKKSITLNEDPKIIAKLALMYAKKYSSSNLALLYLSKAKNCYKRVVELDPNNNEFKEEFDKALKG